MNLSFGYSMLCGINLKYNEIKQIMQALRNNKINYYICKVCNKRSQHHRLLF